MPRRCAGYLLLTQLHFPTRQYSADSFQPVLDALHLAENCGDLKLGFKIHAIVELTSNAVFYKALARDPSLSFGPILEMRIKAWRRSTNVLRSLITVQAC